MKPAFLIALASYASAQRPVPAVVSSLAQKAAASHPTLPSRWSAFVQEDEVGWVLESYLMVQEPTTKTPSAKWTK